ncbi:unnamed protein product [Phytophthora fragariaefolia]|uniref:Unnamed protein product n=1 Tax=Phytophthora fragariaefolia TaxID=1490495 RepID=A0A9W6YC25_9STRA|nr:unnamed protein product [Phytophthora fragariaefolia]
MAGLSEPEGLTNYLRKYSENYAEMDRPLSNLLKKGAEWRWNAEHQDAFEAIKESLLHAPILALPDPDRPISVICDASDFAIGCALLQSDVEGRERPFVIYTDHLSLRIATQSPHLSQRIDGWLAFFAEYNFEVMYKPEKQNALDDAVLCRPAYELAHVTTVTSPIPDLMRASNASDDMCVAMLKILGSKVFENSDKKLSVRLRARPHPYAFDGGLLYYSTGYADPPRVVVPLDEELKYRILYEAHDTPVGGHLGRENPTGL